MLNPLGPKEFKNRVENPMCFFVSFDVPNDSEILTDLQLLATFLICFSS